MKQKIIITALPNGSSTRGLANTWSVSAAIGLQVEDANTTLQNVPDMLNWATLVKDAKFLVQINGAVVEAKVVSKPVDTQLWKNLFSPTVKVKSFVQEDLSKIPIASYPIKHVLGFIKFVVESTGKNFANDLPSATDYTENPLMNQLSDYQIADFPKPNGREKNTLDKLINKKRTGRIVKGRLNELKFIPFDATAKPEEDFAQLKNFHGLYDKNQVETFVQIPPPEFEFHNILSALSTYPQLMRRLGLVIDLEFSGPAANTIMKAGAITNIRVVPSNINFTTATQFICPATAYTKTTGGFYAKPLDGSSIDKGHLKINSDGFTVFQVDTDGAALKMCQQMDGLLLKKAKHIFYASEGKMPNAAFIPAYNNEAPRKEGLPTHRTAGIAVAKDGRAAAINASFKRMNDWKGKLMTGAAAPAGVTGNNASWILTTELLYADDINLGYRMDIQPEGSKWFSLHKRNNKYAYLNTSGNPVDISGVETDEGYIQTSASEEKTDTGTQLKIGEAIARWEGWSLSVPRPGSSLNDPMLDHDNEVYDKSKAGNTAKEEAKYKTPGTADFKLNVKPSIEKGSLPMLRFGKKYSVKIRTVDLAGNSVAVDFTPENADTAVVGNIKYMRYEPVDTPFLVLGNVVKDGESSEVMVIRSNEGSTTAQYENANKYATQPATFKPESIRHVKPPRTTVEMATTHSMLDKGFGISNTTEAANIYNKIKNEKDPFVTEADSTYKLKVIDGSQKKITVEYLADPMAAGVSFFISSNDPNPKLPNPEIMTRSVSFYFDNEVKTEGDANQPVNYDQWMDPKSFRIILLEGAPAINWDGAERSLTVALPKGLIFKMNYASFWRPDDVIKYSGILNMMGMNNLVDAVGKRISKGQHWMFSPWREITFIHAVQQPISAVGSQPYPIIKNITVQRDFGANFALLNTRLIVHGPSTDKLDIEGEWTEWIDDVSHVNIEAGAKDDVQRIPTKAKVFHFTTLYAVYEYVFGELVKNNPFTAVQHKFNDTKHRRVTYKSIASTRYREYFFNLIADKGDAFSLTRESVKTNVMMIPSSARPVAPQVEYVIPTFEWDRVDKGSTIISGRASGLRIYLKRPWYSSGEGEQLGVVLRLNITDNLSSRSVPVTTWGTDPTKLSATLPNGTTPDYKSFVGIDEKNLEPAAFTVEDEKARVTVIPYDVKYDKDRQLYYVDVMMNPVAAYYPFVRFALVRYQKNSVRKETSDCCISAIVQADYIQIPPPRLASLQFGSVKTQITVAMSGTIPNVPQAAMFRTKIQFIVEPIQFNSSEDTHISVDVKPIDVYEYILQPTDIKNFGFVHSHVFRIPDEYASKPYRVKVLEYEMITYDPLKPNPNPGGVNFGGPPMKDRLVFAEVYEINKS